MKKIHFIGIGGIGLSGLARFLHSLGYTISGSDIRETKITKALKNEGIQTTIPHNSTCINTQDYIIYSAAIKPSNEELKKAKELQIKTLSRSEALKEILKDKTVYSVCGAHGKSTTSAILSSIKKGNAIIGAEAKHLGSNVRFDGSETVIFEADESDGSFLNSNPHVAIVTNAEPEHMEFYDYDEGRFFDAYEQFLKKAKKRVINAEDPFLSTLNNLEAIRLYPTKDIKNLKTILKNGIPHCRFNLKNLGEFEVCGSGMHIAIDASLCILSVLDEQNTKDIKKNLLSYEGIKKRFDILHVDKKCAIIDDYGHHPTEIKATIKSVFDYAKLSDFQKITAIWQPHKYSRTLDNMKEFIDCFEGVDELIILPVWNVGEDEVNIDFAELFKSYNPTFSAHIIRKPLHVETQEGRILNDGVIIGFGAGDITYQLRGTL